MHECPTRLLVTQCCIWRHQDRSNFLTLPEMQSPMLRCTTLCCAWSMLPRQFGKLWSESDGAKPAKTNIYSHGETSVE